MIRGHSFIILPSLEGGNVGTIQRGGLGYLFEEVYIGFGQPVSFRLINCNNTLTYSFV